MIQNNDITTLLLDFLINQKEGQSEKGMSSYMTSTPPICKVFLTRLRFQCSRELYCERMQMTDFILPWMISLAHHRHGNLVEQRMVPGVAVIPALRMQLYQAWMQRQLSTSVPIFQLLLHTWHPPLQQFMVPLGVPLQPVLMILLFWTMMDPTASFRHAALSFKTTQMYRKYSLQLGRNSLMMSLCCSKVRIKVLATMVEYSSFWTDRLMNFLTFPRHPKMKQEQICISIYTYEIIKKDEIAEAQALVQSRIMRQHSIRKIMKPFFYLLLDVDEIKVISRRQEMQIRVIGDICQDYPGVELRADQLFYSAVVQRYVGFLLQLLLATHQQLLCEWFIFEPLLDFIVKMLEEGHLKQLEALLLPQKLMQLLHVYPNSIKQSDPYGIQLKPFDELRLQSYLIDSFPNLDVILS